MANLRPEALPGVPVGPPFGDRDRREPPDAGSDGALGWQFAAAFAAPEKDAMHDSLC
jgi:hypothetical protein